jgi:hypothetical protein
MKAGDRDGNVQRPDGNNENRYTPREFVDRACLVTDPSGAVLASADTYDPRMVHWSPTNSCEVSVLPS